MDYFTNQWLALENVAKQIIIICGLIMVVALSVTVKVLSEYDKFKYGPDDDGDEEIEIED
jgi:tetrahydromethanopterin S-methyltransferase subunit E